MRRTALVLLPGVFAWAGLVLIAPPAFADRDLSLPLSSFAAMVVDEAHGHVFVTGPRNDVVVVRDLAGSAVTTITNEPAGGQMALSEDGGTLYLTLPGVDAISAISTTTLTETARYSTGSNTCPSAIATASGEVWFGLACGTGAELGELDPTAAPATVTLNPLPSSSNLASPNLLRTSAAKPGLLLAGDVAQSSTSTLGLLDVSTGSVNVTATTALCGCVQDFTFTNDGAQVLTAENGSTVGIYSSTDLTQAGTIAAPAGTDAVAGSSEGVVAEGFNGPTSASIDVVQPNGSSVRTYNWPRTQADSIEMYPRGLAFRSGASVLYAITQYSLSSTIELHVLYDASKYPSTITMTLANAAAINHAFSVSGTLHAATPIPSGAVLAIRRDSIYGTVTLPSRTTDGNGSFALTDLVPKRGSYGYTATWAGDATHAGTSTRLVVYVKGLTTTITIPTSGGPWAYGARPLIVAHLGPTRIRSIRIYAMTYRGKPAVLLSAGPVDSHGNRAVYYTIRERTQITASYAGDDTYEPLSVSKQLRAYAKVTSWLTHFYSSSGGYKLFHRGTEPYLFVDVSPYNYASCVRVYVQRYYSGTWHTALTACFWIGVSSPEQYIVAVLKTDAPLGTRYRMRGIFLGALWNVATAGTWQYLEITR